MQAFLPQRNVYNPQTVAACQNPWQKRKQTSWKRDQFDNHSNSPRL